LGAADEAPVAVSNRGAGLEITWFGWVTELATLAELPGFTDDGASRAEDCVPGETTFTALLRGADAAPARDATPARPSASGAAKWGTAEDAETSGACAAAAQVHPRIPIADMHANPRFASRMASSHLFISKLSAAILADILAN
jgi:hypothetical protein